MIDLKRFLQLLKSVLVFYFICNLYGCIESDPLALSTVPAYDIQPGDIIISEYLEGQVYQYDSNGNFKNVILDVSGLSGDAPYGLSWDETTRQVLVSVDSSTGNDRIMGVGAYKTQTVEVFRDTAGDLAGTMRGVTRDTNGNYLVIDTHDIEKYDSSFNRLTSSGSLPFLVAPFISVGDISALSSGGFVACSYGSDEVKVFDSAGIVQGTASSYPGTTDGNSCVEMSNGNIAVAWSGTSDTIVIYDNTLSTVLHTFSNGTFMQRPTGISQAPNGNLLISDSQIDQVIEIDSEANYIRNLNTIAIQNPWDILVIPSFE